MRMGPWDSRPFPRASVRTGPESPAGLRPASSSRPPSPLPHRLTCPYLRCLPHVHLIYFFLLPPLGPTAPLRLLSTSKT